MVTFLKQLKFKEYCWDLLAGSKDDEKNAHVTVDRTLPVAELPFSPAYMWLPNFYLQSLFSTLACSPVPPPNNLKWACQQYWRLKVGCQMHTQDGNHIHQGSEDAELLADFTFSRIT